MIQFLIKMEHLYKNLKLLLQNQSFLMVSLTVIITLEDSSTLMTLKRVIYLSDQSKAIYPNFLPYVRVLSHQR